MAAVDVLSKCEIVYVERFTSFLSEVDMRGLNALLKTNTKLVQRCFVEDGRDILETAKTKEVALVTYGDPLIATTHNELRLRAARNSIKTAILHSASGIASAIGETGLHAYKFGRMVTMMSELHSAVTVYNTIYQNLLAGSHTLILTEYRYDDNDNDDHDDNSKEPFFLNPHSVFEKLLDAELTHKHRILSDDTFAVVASRVGTQDQKIASGKIKSLMKLEFGTGPHTIIITGSLHFTEIEALISLTENNDKPIDNSQRTNRTEAQMVERYAPKAKDAVEETRKVIGRNPPTNKGVFETLENAECYIADAQQFLRQGNFELAVLSIGYAEGLIDALRYQMGINPWSTRSNSQADIYKLRKET